MNGKGDRNRTTDYEKYGENRDAIYERKKNVDNVFSLVLYLLIMGVLIFFAWIEFN